jgi:hypothetical protein
LNLFWDATSARSIVCAWRKSENCGSAGIMFCSVW